MGDITFVDDNYYTNFLGVSSLKEKLQKEIQKRKEQEAKAKMDSLQTQLDEVNQKLKDSTTTKETKADEVSIKRNDQVVAQPQPSGKPKWLFPLLIGGGSVVLGVVIYFAFRKK